MSAERALPTGFQDAIESGLILPVILVEADFPDGIVRLWSGLGTREFLGETWRGVGSLLSIPSIKERTDGGIYQITVALSGIDSNIFNPVAALGDYQGRECSIRLGALVGETETIVGPLTLFRGYMDEDEHKEDGQESVIQVTARSKDSDKARRRPWLYSHEDQEDLHPGDLGLSRVAEIEGKPLTW